MHQSIYKALIFIFLVVLSFNGLSQTELITSNRDFSNGSSSGWTTYGDINIVGSGYSKCYSCPGYAALGVDNQGYAKDNAYAVLRREVTIPSNVKKGSDGYIRFYLYITTVEPDNSKPFDKFSIRFESSSSGYSWNNIYSNMDYSSGYKRMSLKLSDIDDFAGEKMILTFIEDSDNRSPTTFRIDDMSIQVETSSGSSLPDLTTWDQTVSPKSLFAGDEMQVSCVHGQKTGSLSGVIRPNVGIFLSSNQEWDGSDIELDQSSSSLNESTPYTSESDVFDIPTSTSPGQYYILFVADYRKEVKESDETNNVCAVLIIVKSKTPSTGKLTVNISPSSAISDGAHWQIDNDGNWRTSGTQIELSTGNHTVSYKGIAGWETPRSELVTIMGGGTESLTGKYVSNIKRPLVTILTPNEYKCYRSGQEITISAYISGDFSYKEIQFTKNGNDWIHIDNVNNNYPELDYSWELPYTNNVQFIQIRVLAHYKGGVTADSSDDHICIIGDMREEIFVTDGVSSIFWPFEIKKYSWSNQGKWIVTAGHGDGYHLEKDYYSLDYARHDKKLTWDKGPKAVLAGCNKSYYSPMDGTIIHAVDSFDKDCDDKVALKDGLGNYIVIQSSKNRKFLFVIGHLNEVIMTSGNISRGDKIGEVGSTGNSDGPHAHCTLYQNAYEKYRYKSEPNIELSPYDILSTGRKWPSLSDAKEVEHVFRTYAAEFQFDAKEVNGGGQAGINSNNEDLFNVSPNPAVSTITISSLGIISNVAVSNSVGKCVILKSPAKNQIEISLENLDSGFYIVSLEVDGNWFYKKIIKK